jgi:RecB family exonuclease
MAYSHSAVKAFETCPWRYYLTKVAKKVKEPQTQQTLEGNQVHKALEKHIKGEAWLPEKYKKYIPIAELVKKGPGKVEAERKFALTAAFAETAYFAKDVWLRGVFDVAVIQPSSVTVLDWKTGKVKPDPDQINLFAASAFKLYPNAETVHAGYVWLQHMQLTRETYTREQTAPVWADFIARTKRIEIAHERDEWPKRPSGLCREYCPVGKSLCEHCGE